MGTNEKNEFKSIFLKININILKEKLSYKYNNTMTKKIIYVINCINGKTFINTSKTKISNDLKNYIMENNLTNDGWYYPTPNQLDNLINNRGCAGINFITDIYKCDVVDLFNDEININNKRINGRDYNKKTIENKRNRLINNKINDIVNGNREINYNKFQRISVN
jgi:hypothetical protein